MATSRIRAAYLGGDVLSFEQKHTSVTTDFGHGLGDIITNHAAKLPVGQLTFAQTIFALTQVPLAVIEGLVGVLLFRALRDWAPEQLRTVFAPAAEQPAAEPEVAGRA